MVRQSQLSLCVLAFVLVSGFRGKDVGTDHLPPAETPRGHIAGRVTVDGRVAYPRTLAVTKHRGFCGTAVRNEAVQLGRDGEVRNTVVFLTGSGLDDRPQRSHRITLDNVGCRFVPHVQAMRAGGILHLMNSDPILHDAHGRARGQTLFNDGLPTWRRVERQLDQPGVVKIVCELHHAWMSAYVVVTPNGYFAVTDAEGRFRIQGVPAGTYEMEFWHEHLGKIRRKVQVEKDQVTRIETVFSTPLP